MNQIILTGRLTKDVELKYTSSNKPVANFTIAVNRIGQKEADFINCIAWNGQAENLYKYQGKGSLVLINGSLRNDKYQDNEGNNRYRTYVLTSNIEYLDSKKNKNSTDTLHNTAENTENSAEQSDPFKDFSEEVVINDDDLPF